MLSTEWAERVKLSEISGGWLINVLFCDGFFDSASVLTKSVAEMTFRLAYILNVTFVTLYHINDIGRRAGDVMSYASLFVGRCFQRQHDMRGKENASRHRCEEQRMLRLLEVT